jgi:hypothetical protein
MNGSHHSLRKFEQQRLEVEKWSLEFVRQPDLSTGLYLLPVGEINFSANVGNSIFVPAKLEHRFHAVEEKLRVIVVFAPAEYSRKTS